MPFSLDCLTPFFLIERENNFVDAEFVCLQLDITLF